MDGFQVMAGLKRIKRAAAAKDQEPGRPSAQYQTRAIEYCCAANKVETEAVVRFLRNQVESLHVVLEICRNTSIKSRECFGTAAILGINH